MAVASSAITWATATPPPTGALGSMLLAVIGSDPEPWSVDELLEAVPEGGPEALRGALSSLLRADRVRSVGALGQGAQDLYLLPEPSATSCASSIHPLTMAEVNALLPPLEAL